MKSRNILQSKKRKEIVKNSGVYKRLTSIFKKEDKSKNFELRRFHGHLIQPFINDH